LASAADTSDDEPFWNGLADVERDVEIDRVAFTFVAEVVVASDAAVDVDLLCDAVAADLGAVAENSRCALVSTTALVGRYEKHSPEWEAEAEKLRAGARQVPQAPAPPPRAPGGEGEGGSG
jgi:hypothetical protein